MQAVSARINEQRELVETVHKLALSVQEMATAQRYMGDEQQRLRTEVDALRLKPAARWDGLVGHLISLLVAALVGGFLAKIF